MFTSWSRALTTTLVLLVIEYSFEELISYFIRDEGREAASTLITTKIASTTAVIARE
jgi:hypothetical protein